MISDTPLYNAIKAYAESGTVPFHMPGHKLGSGFPAEYLSRLVRLDVTELPGTDNLKQPSGAIREAQELAAKAFGSLRTFFLVNGSTCGIQAMIAAACKPGDSLIVGRDSHRSVIGGMLLAGIKPVYVLPEYNADFGIITSVTPQSVEEALYNHPEARGVLLTRPNYYGVCGNIKEIADIVHAHGKLLLVDEAHGAHFCFSRRLPQSALEAGADIVVQSAHKTLPALTQGAYLHVGSGDVDQDRLEYFLGILQTSSPSYLIMTSLDIARELMQTHAPQKLDTVISYIDGKKREISSKPYTILSGEHLGGLDLDGTRITICVKGMGISGYEAEAILREYCGIQIEMADPYNIVCIATVADSEESLERLFTSLGRLADMCRGRTPVKADPAYSFQLPEMVLDPAAAIQSESGWVSLELSADRISKAIVAPYPPGIPVLCPGERISGETVEYLKAVISSGGQVNGINENMEINVV